MKHIYTLILAFLGMASMAQISSASMYSLSYNWPIGKTFTSFNLGIGTMVVYQNSLVRNSNGYIMSTSFSSGFVSDNYVNAATISGNHWENIYSVDEGNGLIPDSKEHLYSNGTVDTLFVKEDYDDVALTYSFDHRSKIIWQSGVLKEFRSEWFDGTTWQPNGRDVLHYAGGQVVFDTSYSSTGSIDNYSIYHRTGTTLDSIVTFSYDFNLLALVKEQKLVFTYTGGFASKADQYSYDEVSGSPQYEISFLFDGSSGIGVEDYHIAPMLYPNPAMDYVNLPEGAERVVVYDLSGKRYGNLRLSGNVLDVSELPSGMYVVSINGNQMARLIKK